MGYTHYVRRKKVLGSKRAFAAAAADCKAVCRRLMTGGLDLREEYDNPAAPVFTADRVQFNGWRDDGHETFLVQRVYEPYPIQAPERGRWFSFCKTARKPYDLAVCACLVVLHHHFGDRLTVSSDSDDEENWPAARAACQEVLGYGEAFRLPRPHDDLRFGAVGLAMKPSVYSNEKHVYSLDNGWGVYRRRGGEFRRYAFEVGRPRRSRWYAFDSPYPSDFSAARLVCEARSAKELGVKAAAEHVRREFATCPEVGVWCDAVAATGDLWRFAVYADLLDDRGLAADALRLRRLLPKRMAGAVA